MRQPALNLMDDRTVKRINYKRGSTAPEIRVKLIDEGTREPYDLEDIDVSIRFYMLDNAGEMVQLFDRPCTVDITKTTEAFYSWGLGDLNFSGAAYCCFAFVDSVADTTAIYPKNNYVMLEVY